MSAQALGSWGAPALMLIGVTSVVLAVGIALRRSHRNHAQPANLTLVGTLVFPPLVPLVIFVGLSAPGDYCSSAEQKEERAADGIARSALDEQGWPVPLVAHEPALQWWARRHSR